MKTQHNSIILKPLVLAIHMSIFTSAMLFTSQTTFANTASVQNYQIKAGALSDALIEFSLKSGSTLTVDHQKLQGLKTSGLSGQYSIDAGFKKLLESTPYTIQKNGNAYVLVEKSKLAQPQARDMGELAPIDVSTTATSQTLAAANGSNVMQLPIITVNAIQDGYAPNKVTIGKMDQSLKEIPQSVSVMTRQQLDDLNATTLEDAMRYATGIGAYGNTDGSDGFYARNGAVNLSYNGVPSTANNQFDLAVYDQIEILRGPNGLLSGSGNPTGTINLVRKRALDQFQANIATSIGSWQNYRTEIDITNALNQSGSVRGRAIVVGEDREYFYDHADSNKILGSGILEFDLSPATVLGVAATIQQANLTPFSGYPGDNKGNLLGLDRSTNLDAKYNQASRDTWEIMGDLTHQFNDNWKTQATVRYYEGDYQGISGNPRVAVDTATNKMGFAQARSISEQKNLAADLHLNGNFDLFGQKHELLLGVNYDERLTESGSASLPTFYTDNWTNPGYANPDDIPDIARKSETKTIQSGLYGMLRIRPIEQLSIILGSRFSDYSTKSRTSYPATTTWAQGAKETGEFTPYGGLVFEFNKEISWYASYADVFIPQTTKDYQGVVLEPRVGWQAETGLKASFLDGRLNTNIAYFRIREENAAMPDPDPTHVCTNENTGAVTTCQVAGGLIKTEGWEAEVFGEVLTGLNLSASYTHSEKTPIVGNVGQGSLNKAYASSTSSPKDVFKLWANYKFQPDFLNGQLNGLSLGGGIYAVGETFGWGWTEYHLRQGGYTTVALQGGYEFNNNLSASLTVNNLFDKTYYRQLNDERSYNNYGDPRNFMLTLRAKY